MVLLVIRFFLTKVVVRFAPTTDSSKITHDSFRGLNIGFHSLSRLLIAIDRAVNRHLEDSLLLELAPPPVLEETLLAQTGLHGNLLAPSTKSLLQTL